MRFRSLLLLCTIGSALGMGCGENIVKMGDGSHNPGGGGPTVTPDPAQFPAVQAWMEDGAKANCGKSTCHTPPSGIADLALYTNTSGGTTAEEVTKNREAMHCDPFTTSYSDLGGSLYTTFCEPNGDALTPPQHAGRTNLTNADCQTLSTWLKTGSGSPPDC